ncbi:MAG: SPOR domain-containing protein [Thiotrichaceae bacterium]|nr:SPOR domain-containing protein [Thiotrichaceae bacterium]
MARGHINSDSSASGGYLSSYGLTHEPFVGEMLPASFYPGATREQRLNLLLHLIPLGEILLITGMAGMGKTTLLEQFVAKRKESWRICRLDGSAGLDSNQLLQQLVMAFSPEIAGHADRSEIERLLISQLQLLRKNAQQAMLLIDNAQHLPESGFRALGKFIVDGADEEKLLGVVLFSEPKIEEKLGNPALQVLRGQIKHTFELPLLSEEETQQYLDHRIQAAGFQGSSPFTAAVNKAVFGASKGLPAKINELAQAVMQNKQHVAVPRVVEEKAGVEPLEKRKARRISLSMVWPFAAAIVLAAVLVFQDEFNALFDSPAEDTEAVTAAVAELPVIVTESVTQDAEAKVTQTVVDGIVSLKLDDVIEPEIAVPDVVVKALAADAPLMVEPDEVVPMAVAKVEAAGPAIVEPAVIETTAIEPNKAALPVATLAMIAPLKEASQKAPVAANVPIPKGGWVSAQPPQAYTLQIVAQQKIQKREAFITRFELEEKIERFSTNKKGARWYVAAIGVYDSRTAALEASRQLPAGVVPWVRSFASIQKELWQEELARGAVKSTERVAKPLASARNSALPLTDQERWVMARAPEHYVLQLAAFEKKAKTQDFLESHQLQGSGKSVRLINKGRLWYAVIYGDVANRPAALQLADDLENSKGISRPWVRTFGSLQRAVEKTQQ